MVTRANDGEIAGGEDFGDAVRRRRLWNEGITIFNWKDTKGEWIHESMSVDICCTIALEVS